MALSRIMSIGAMISLLLILFMCVFIFWAARSRTVHPFLVSVNSMTGQWQIIGHDHGHKTVSTNQTLQESVLSHFVKNWFTISSDVANNSARWQSVPDMSKCSDGNSGGLIACSISEDLYKHFVASVIPDYENRIANGETWSVALDSIHMTPMGAVESSGAIWQIHTVIESNLYGPINIVAYATIANSKLDYPQTMGYYILDFNAYKLDR